MKHKLLYKPSKEWLKEYYSYNKDIVNPDKTIYLYPDDHLNFLNAEKYLNNIIKILNRYDSGYDSIKFVKSQPCIYNNIDYENHPYWWSYSGKIYIYINKNCKLNKKSIRYIKRLIRNLNIGYEYICKIHYKDKEIYDKIIA